MIALKFLSDRELLQRLRALGATYQANLWDDRFKVVGVVHYKGARFQFHESNGGQLTLADQDSRNHVCSVLEAALAGG